MILILIAPKSLFFEVCHVVIPLFLQIRIMLHSIFVVFFHPPLNSFLQIWMSFNQIPISIAQHIPIKVLSILHEFRPLDRPLFNLGNFLLRK